MLNYIALCYTIILYYIILYYIILYYIILYHIILYYTSLLLSIPSTRQYCWQSVQSHFAVRPAVLNDASSNQQFVRAFTWSSDAAHKLHKPHKLHWATLAAQASQAAHDAQKARYAFCCPGEQERSRKSAKRAQEQPSSSPEYPR